VPTEPRPEDWELLGLEPDAGAAEVQRAFRRRRKLYSPDSMASYSLLSEEERGALLERLEAARRRILASLPAGDLAIALDDDRAVERPLEPGPEDQPELDRHPGAYLGYHRRRSGLSLEQVSEVTKIRRALVDQIERDAYDKLPAPVYVRGFVLELARLLALANPEEVARSYLAQMAAHSLDD